MPELHIFNHDGRPRTEVNGVILRSNRVIGSVLGPRQAGTALAPGLRMVDILLDEAPGSGVARSLIACVKEAA